MKIMIFWAFSMKGAKFFIIESEYSRTVLLDREFRCFIRLFLIFVFKLFIVIFLTSIVFLGFFIIALKILKININKKEKNHLTFWKKRSIINKEKNHNKLFMKKRCLIFFGIVIY